MICGSTRYEFNFKDNDEEYDIGAFLVVQHADEVRKKYFADKQLGSQFPSFKKIYFKLALYVKPTQIFFRFKH